MNFQEFKDRYQFKAVEEYPNKKCGYPLVSVCVQTYNHVNYIRACLDGILMQKTNFHFEVLLGDDGSTDGTRDICVAYAQRYPDKIRLFLHHRENNIKINDKPTGRFNFLYNLFSARGKYIAFCEGDDYWCYARKLDKKVNFLNKHPSYALVANNIMTLKKNIPLPSKLRINRNVTTSELIRGCPISTPTILFRRSMLADIPEEIYIEAPMADWPTYILLSLNGKIRLWWQYWSVYRIHGDGIYSMISSRQKLRYKVQSRELIINYLPNQLKKECREVIVLTNDVIQKK